MGTEPLVEEFLAHLPDRRSYASLPQLDVVLRGMLDRVRNTWPTLEIDEIEVVGKLARQLPADGDPTRNLAAVHIADLCLAWACARGDARALQILDHDVLRDLPRWMPPDCSAPEFIDEVKQAVRALVLVSDGGAPRIVNYSGQGPLGAWLRVVAVRTAGKLRRKLRTEHQRELSGELLAPAADPELALLRASHKKDFTAAIQDSLAVLSNRQRQVLRLYFLDELTLERIGLFYRVHQSTVLRWLQAAERALFDETRRLLRERLRVTDAEVQSLIDLARSQLGLSLRTFFGSRL